jgi:hypothetical protein
LNAEPDLEHRDQWNHNDALAATELAGQLAVRVEVHDSQALATAGNQTALDLDRDSRGSRRIGAVTAPAERLDEVERIQAASVRPSMLGRTRGPTISPSVLEVVEMKGCADRAAGMARAHTG